MKNWGTSLDGALMLSFVHFLLEMWRGFLDFSFVLPDYSGGSTGTMALYALVYTAIFATWLLGLSNARQGKRGGIITALVLDALFWAVVDLSTIFFYCPGGCEHVVFDITTWVAIIVGALALFGLGMNLRQPTTQQAQG